MQRLDAQTQQRITVRRNEDTPASRNLCARGASAASSLCMSLLSLGLSKVTPYPGDARGILRLAPREATEPVILSAAGAKDLLFPYIGRRSGRPEGEPCVREGAMGGMEDLQPALGLDLLVPGAKGLALALLRGINPFSLYGVFLTATGIAVTHKTSKGGAY